VDISPVSTSAPPAGGASITDLARQHGVSRHALLEFVRSKIQETRAASGQPPLDEGTLDEVISHTLGHGDEEPETASAGYTSSARSVPERAGGAGSISVFA
jgi:transposase-like protein